MSIGADWRQISPGNVSGVSGATAQDAGAGANAADRLTNDGTERSFSEYMFGEDGFEFSDLLDVINPLQHIPGVGMLYRSITGDELGNGARLAGGGLFGGVFGLAGAAIDAVVDLTTGEDTGTHVMAFLEDGFDSTPANGPVLADAGRDAAQPAHSSVAQNDAAGVGSYQGALVLPWANGQGMAAKQPASAAEQATIVDKAPVEPVENVQVENAQMGDVQVGAGDQTVLAAKQATGLHARHGLANPVVSPDDLNPPWQQGASARMAAGTTAAPGASHSPDMAQTPSEDPANAVMTKEELLARMATNPPPASAAQPAAESAMASADNRGSGNNQPDPAELAVAMARAGQVDLAANFSRQHTVASQSGAHNPIRPASFTSDGGNTVWSRAQSSGRVLAGGASRFAHPELSAHDAGAAKTAGMQAEQAQAEGGMPERTQTERAQAERGADKRGADHPELARRDLSSPFDNTGAPLSAAEMAARFNAALGRDSAGDRAADARAATKTVADDRAAQIAARGHDAAGRISSQAASQSASRSQSQPPQPQSAHPMMEQATSHMNSGAPVGAWFSQSMMNGLQKYQEMQQSRASDGSSI